MEYHIQKREVRHLDVERVICDTMMMYNIINFGIISELKEKKIVFPFSVIREYITSTKSSGNYEDRLKGISKLLNLPNVYYEPKDHVEQLRYLFSDTNDTSRWEQDIINIKNGNFFYVKDQWDENIKERLDRTKLLAKTLTEDLYKISSMDIAKGYVVELMDLWMHEDSILIPSKMNGIAKIPELFIESFAAFLYNKFIIHQKDKDVQIKPNDILDYVHLIYCEDTDKYLTLEEDVIKIIENHHPKFLLSNIRKIQNSYKQIQSMEFPSKEYTPSTIETKWQDLWQKKQLYKVSTNTQKPKYYVLDMFPYPSGAGLHVGHPLGYIASDIIARYKRLKGFNVLHPMGFDSFGLPAEQYAIETGQHPKITTENNIATFKNQLGKIGFCYDWDKEIRTSSPDYYKWTQWIFKQLFDAWYNNKSKKAERIATLIAEFEKNGNANVDAACDEDTQTFSATEWKNFSAKEKSDRLLQYRLTYLADAFVNWCPALGSVLANDEVKDGVSERGGHPVERKKMRQWMMRITAYAERLLNDLDLIDWSESIKEIQRNWIGKSLGAELRFQIAPQHPKGEFDVNASVPPSVGRGLGIEAYLEVFTTRIDTTFGVTYLAIAPEHELVPSLTTPEQKQAVADYVEKAANRSERDRMSDVKTVSGVFTGSYVINPFNDEKIPVWIADYVLAGYGTGVVMAVPSSDDRDFRFAKHYNLPIINVIEGAAELENPTDKKYGKMVNSGFLNGLDTDEAITKAIEFAEKKGVGKAKINYKMRDAVFGRQRYWGEPVPIYFDENNIPHLLSDDELPLVLPEIDQYKPTENGEPPLGRATNWKYKNKFEYELSTMPGWAGSSWYWLRYMDNKNDKEFVSKEAENYWQSVDLYVGGAEHGTGHLLYSRFWNKFLYDLGYVSAVEPFKKLINQGMIQGRSNFVYKLKDSNKFVSLKFKDKYEAVNIQELHVDVNIVENDVLDLEKFKVWRPEYADAEFEMEDGKYVCGYTVEKMSKRWYNVVNPDDVVNRYSADTLRLYEMFLGPLEQFKPWNMQGIDGTHKFLKKLWRLFYDDKGNFRVTNAEATKDELKTLHKTIKKIEEDMERFSFNTPVSTFMICVNELTEQKCYKNQILADLLVILAPYAPHIVEELWFALLQYQNPSIENWQAEYSVMNASFPVFKEEYLVESSFEYPVSINGKMRHKITLPLDLSIAEVEKEALASEVVQKWLEGKAPKKVIVVQGKIVNVVV